LPPILAQQLLKTREQAASKRALTRAEGGQVQADVGRPFTYHDAYLVSTTLSVLPR